MHSPNERRYSSVQAGLTDLLIAAGSAEMSTASDAAMRQPIWQKGRQRASEQAICTLSPSAGIHDSNLEHTVEVPEFSNPMTGLVQIQSSSLVSLNDLARHFSFRPALTPFPSKIQN